MELRYMGVDIGTSGCKAVVFDERGKQVSQSGREYDLTHTHDGGAELDSDEVMEKTFEVIRESAGASGPVRGLGVSSQGEAFTPLDEKDRGLCGAMVSSDTRAAPYLDRWVEELGAAKLYGTTGHTAHPMFSLFKFMWLRDHRPDIWKRTRRFYCFEDLLHLRLGIEPAISWPLAGRTMLFDVTRHDWDGEILAAAGLAPEQLARPAVSGSRVGSLSPEKCRLLGLGEETFVVTAGHDQPCGALGAGVTEPGVGMYATGTVECITPALERPVFSDGLMGNNLCTYDHAVPGMYTTAAFSLTGGNALKWFRDEFGALERAESERTGVNAYTLLLDRMGKDPTDLLVLPYLTPSGTPYFDLTTPGAILGLRLTSRREDILRSLLEGVTLEMRLNLDILEKEGCPVQELRAIGGGARSPVWVQLKADVLGKAIVTLDVTEAACLGAAMLARAEDTGEDVREVAGQWIHPVEEVRPCPEAAERYSEKFEEYRRMYPLLRKIRPV